MTSVATDQLGRRLARLRTQAWVGTRTPTEDQFVPITLGERSEPWVKPDGGMWTSTYMGPYGSDWCQYCISEGLIHYDRGITGKSYDREDYDEVRFDIRAQIYKLHPVPSARVYLIDSYADLEALIAEYGSASLWTRLGIGEQIMPREYPDWRFVARDFDGVALTQEGQWATRLTMPHNLYGWDCESTLWLRWAFDSVRDVGIVRLKFRDPWWDDYQDKYERHLLSRYSEGRRAYDQHRRRERRAERNRYYV